MTLLVQSVKLPLFIKLLKHFTRRAAVCRADLFDSSHGLVQQSCDSCDRNSMTFAQF